MPTHVFCESVAEGLLIRRGRVRGKVVFKSPEEKKKKKMGLPY